MKLLVELSSGHTHTHTHRVVAYAMLMQLNRRRCRGRRHADSIDLIMVPFGIRIDTHGTETIVQKQPGVPACVRPRSVTQCSPCGAHCSTIQTTKREDNHKNTIHKYTQRVFNHRVGLVVCKFDRFSLCIQYSRILLIAQLDRP